MVRHADNLARDWDRVVRTETVNARNEAATVKLERMAKLAGIADPLVYKIVRPGACVQCRRIYGEPGSPKVYRLSFVRQRGEGGGNIGLKPAQWGPVPGATHPNCTCGHLLLYDPEIRSSLAAFFNEESSS